MPSRNSILLCALPLVDSGSVKRHIYCHHKAHICHATAPRIDSLNVRIASSNRIRIPSHSSIRNCSVHSHSSIRGPAYGACPIGSINLSKESKHTVAHIRQPRPESGPDCLICAMFARQREEEYRCARCTPAGRFPPQNSQKCTGWRFWQKSSTFTNLHYFGC